MEYQSLINGSYTAITASFRWSVSSTGAENIFYALLPKQRIISLLADDEILSRGFLQIYDVQGELLFTHGRPVSGKYSIIEGQCIGNSLQFRLLVPDRLINGRIKPVKHLLLILTLLIVLIIVTIAIFFAYRNSKPMLDLLSSIDSTKIIRVEYEGTKAGGKRGILKYFKEAYTDLAKSINTIDTRLSTSLQTIQKQSQDLKSQVFSIALWRGIYDYTDQEKFRFFFSNFPDRFRLAMIRRDPVPVRSCGETMLPWPHLADLIQAEFPDFYLHEIDDNTIIMLVSAADTEDLLMEKIGSLRKRRNDDALHFLRFSLSDVFNRPQDLFRAYQQIQFDNLQLETSGRTDERQNPAYKHNRQIPLSLNMLHLVYGALCNGDSNTACLILLESASLLPDPEEELYSSFVHGRLSNMIMQLKLEDPAVFANIDVPVYIAGNQKNLFEVQFCECFKKICEITRNNNNITKLERCIMEYINEHLYDPDMYIPNVSEYFGISAPTLQKIVKAITGQTFLSYVERQRLAKAIAMLTEGIEDVNGIAVKCGFSSANSFYKAFKKIYGYPPSQVFKKKRRGNSYT
jgi:AraC-like DNA-binding protein